MNRYRILLLDVEDAETGIESQNNMEYQHEILNMEIKNKTEMKVYSHLL